MWKSESCSKTRRTLELCALVLSKMSFVIQGRRYRGGGGGVWGGVTPPPPNKTLVKVVGQNGSDICPKLVKMELIFA